MSGKNRMNIPMLIVQIPLKRKLSTSFRTYNSLSHQYTLAISWTIKTNSKTPKPQATLQNKTIKMKILLIPKLQVPTTYNVKTSSTTQKFNTLKRISILKLKIISKKHLMHQKLNLSKPLL